MPRTATPAAPLGLSPLGTAVLDALPVSLYIVDRRFRVVAWNARRETGPLGRPRSEVIGRSLREVLPPAGLRSTLPVLRRVLATGTPHDETLETAGSRLFRVGRWPVREGGRVTHVLSWFEDMTERRALEMRLIASDRLAFIGQLVAGVAHEVSNPLAGIAGCAEALASLALKAEAPRGRADAREFRDLIRGEVARCERIVRSLLDSARPEAGATAPLASTVETALRLLDRHPAFARVKVIHRISPALPHARIDPDSLKQVVIALATNAARAMAGAGTLRVLGRRSGPSVVLDVQDTGPGVPKAIRSRIFEPFFTTEAQGSGLGLAIARSLVRGRGGDLTYHPRERAGGLFRVTLKAAPGRR